jgi:5'-3' exonuclease
MINENSAPVVVVSADSDYLVFTQCHALIVPTKKYRSIIYRNEMLEFLRGKEKKESRNEIESILKVAACISVQDHVRGIDKYGVSRAMELLRTFPKSGKILMVQEIITTIRYP